MQIAKALKLSCILFISTFITVTYLGCDLFGPEEGDEDKVTIQIGAIGTINAGTATNITGEIEASPDIDEQAITITITDADGNDGSSNFATIAPLNIEETDKIDLQEDLELKLTALSTACNGEYTLKIEVTAGSVTSSDQVSFTVTGGKDCSQPKVKFEVDTVTLGAQQSSHGSALDADELEAYTSSQASANSADMDAVYGIYSSQLTLMSPAFAATAGFGASNWATKNSTQFVELSTPPDPTSSTQSDVDDLYNSGTKVDHLTIAQGDFLIVHTDQGVNRLIAVLSVQAGESGFVVIVGFVEVSI